MNIIFDSPEAEGLRQRHILLELDSFLFDGNPNPIRAWCVVEQIPIPEVSTAEHYKKLHADLIEHYNKRNWNVCRDALRLLMGRWGGELDSFYITLANRIEDLSGQTLPDNWSGVIVKSTAPQASSQS